MSNGIHPVRQPYYIRKVKASVDQNIFDVSLINCLDNLQPLKEFDNLSKNDKYCKNEFKEFLKDKGVLCG